MDPFSDVIRLLKPSDFMSGGIDAGGNWSMLFPSDKGIIRCFSLVSGGCWLSIDGVPDAVALKSEDCVLLPKGKAFILASNLDAPPVGIDKIASAPLKGRIISYNGGGDCLGVTSFFKLSGIHANHLIDVLPSIVHIHKESDKKDIRWCLDKMMRELRDPQPGSFLMEQELAYMILIQTIRFYIKDGLKEGVGWLFALGDNQMSAAFIAMHGDPSYRWTVQELAKLAGMSRSVFALKFKAIVGASPITYLTHWRMMLAGEKIINSKESIASIAFSLGIFIAERFSQSIQWRHGLFTKRLRRPAGEAPFKPGR